MPRKIAIVLIALLIVAMGAYVVVTSLSQEPLTIVGRWIHDNNGASYTCLLYTSFSSPKGRVRMPS